MARAFFLGAGASKADGFPLTRELLWAVAYRALNGRPAVRDFLQTVFHVPPGDLRDAARAWTRFLRSPEASVTVPDSLPHLTDVLSTLDILRDEEGCLGRAQPRRPLGRSELINVRAQVVSAIATGFRDLHRHRKESRRSFVTEQFVGRLGHKDVLVTTNWDILLDIARHERFGTTELDYGTPIEFDWPTQRRKSTRPPILKLHGSLNWLYCARCGKLWAEVFRPIAARAYDARAKRDIRGQCDCAVPLEALLVTPTFVKTYRNLHLQNVWNAALHGLARCSEWVFIGYSLPDDDIHIRTLLLKARLMREERKDPGKSSAVRVSAVLPKGGNADIVKRYKRLFPDIHVHPTGFAGYVAKMREPVSRSGNGDARHKTRRRK